MTSADLWVVIATAVSTGLGWGLSVHLLPPTLSRRFALIFAPAVGLGVCSLFYSVFRRPLFTVEFLLTIVAALLLYRYRARRTFSLLPSWWYPTTLGLVFTLVLGFLLAAFMVRIDRMPHGSWDGWAIWNTHARLLTRGGSDWKTQLQFTFHGDYPQFTPTVAARFWRYAGREIPGTGAMAGIILGLSSIALLIATLSELRDSRIAVVGGIMLMGTPLYLDLMTSQYSEVPLSFFNLATVALLCLHTQRSPESKSILALAGFAAGCAGWTKNEGLLFIAAVCAALAVPVVLGRSRVSERLVPFVSGLLIPLAVIVAFKLTVPVQTDLIEYQSYEAASQRITDLSRYTLISKYFLKSFWVFGGWSITPLVPLLMLIAVRGIDRRMILSNGWRTGCLVLALVLAGYFVVYVNTPIELQDHLDSSFHRLLIHLWPSFLLLLGLSVRSERTPDETRIAEST